MLVQGVDIASLEASGKVRIQELSFSEKSNSAITWKDLESISSGLLNDSAPETSDLSLFIDDLNALEIIAPTHSDARLFVSKTLGSLSPSNTISSLVGFGRYTENECDELSLIEYCRYRADVTVEVKPLSTGFSLDTHGLIQISSRHAPSRADISNHAPNCSPGSGHGLWIQTLLFKALETGVRCSVVRQRI